MSWQPDLFDSLPVATRGVFAIAPGAPFLATLADMLLSGDLPRIGGAAPGPADFADTCVYLPTRGAARQLRALLAQRATRGAFLLPKIATLDDVTQPFATTLPPAIDPVRRHLLLTGLVQSWMRQLSRPSTPGGGEALYLGASPTAAADLAADLARLLDQAHTETIELARLEEVLGGDVAEHWQLTLDFLRIVIAAWPEYLSANGLLDPAARHARQTLLAAQAISAATSGPIIIAGSTGSAPGTVALMRAVLSRGNGAVVLAGHDAALPATVWDELLPGHPTHPHFASAELLRALACSRRDVAVLPAPPEPKLASRAALVAHAMLPPGHTHGWPALRDTIDEVSARDALAGVALLVARDAAHEAEMIALLLRRAVAQPDGITHFVTPDRGLAQRVQASLRRYGIAVADSAGRPLALTPLGALADAIARLMPGEATAADLAALIAHPLVTPGDAAERTGVALQIAACRALWAATSPAGLPEAVARSRRAVAEGASRVALLRELSEAQWHATEALATRLAAAFADVPADGLGALARRHAAIISALLGDAAPEGTAELLARLDALADAQVPGLAVRLADYPALFRTLTRDAVLPPLPGHPRLAILSPLDARLLGADCVILGGLNEGVWPDAADASPWVARPAAAALGMSAGERITGLAAQDFSQMLSAREVWLTRAARSVGTPTMPCRWLTRLAAVAAACGCEDALVSPLPLARWADLAIQPPVARRPAAPPAPRPPVAARPRQLSVTEVARWMANPYWIFARRILALEPLPPLDSAPSAADRGSIVHAVLAAFAQRYPVALPADSAAALIALADGLFAELGARPVVAAFWRPRLARFAAWFAETEPARRDGVTRVAAEVRGRLELDLPGGPFVLTARADRIDLSGSSAAIYDYKTGSAPPDKAGEDFTAPQLPLEAMLLNAGGFAGLGAVSAGKLAYIVARGDTPPGAESALRGLPADLAATAEERLRVLVSRFDDPATPYRAMRRALFKSSGRYDDYAHLARVAEWAGGEGAP